MAKDDIRDMASRRFEVMVAKLDRFGRIVIPKRGLVALPRIRANARRQSTSPTPPAPRRDEVSPVSST